MSLSRNVDPADHAMSVADQDPPSIPVGAHRHEHHLQIEAGNSSYNGYQRRPITWQVHCSRTRAPWWSEHLRLCRLQNDTRTKLHVCELNFIIQWELITICVVCSRTKHWPLNNFNPDGRWLGKKRTLLLLELGQRSGDFVRTELGAIERFEDRMQRQYDGELQKHVHVLQDECRKHVGQEESKLRNELTNALTHESQVYSGYWWRLAPSYRCGNHLDFFCGTPGAVAQPCIYDDGDTPSDKPSWLKMFLDPSEEEASFWARWGACRFEKNQARMVCSNVYDASEEMSKDEVQIELKSEAFMRMIRPLFNPTATPEDVNAILKRSFVIVFGRNHIYMREPSADPEQKMSVHAYWPTNSPKDLLSDAGIQKLRTYRGGDKTPPAVTGLWCRPYQTIVHGNSSSLRGSSTVRLSNCNATRGHIWMTQASVPIGKTSKSSQLWRSSWTSNALIFIRRTPQCRRFQPLPTSQVRLHHPVHGNCKMQKNLF